MARQTRGSKKPTRNPKKDQLGQALEKRIIDFDSSLKRSTSHPNSQEGPVYGATSSQSAGTRVNTSPPPVPAGYETAQRAEIVSNIANNIENIKAKITDLNNKLANCDPQSPLHTELVNTLRSLWLDLSGAHQHFIQMSGI